LDVVKSALALFPNPFVITAADAVRMNEPTATANNKSVEEKIKSWLRQARDRDGGRKRRFEMAVLRRSSGSESCPTSKELGCNREEESAP